MRFILVVLATVVSLAAVPGLALAQSAIVGVVKDATGAVVPGVTVEASSDALIERVKSATTDSAGTVPHCRSASGHVRRHVHADGIPNRAAPGDAAAGGIHRDGGRRDEGRRPTGNDYGHGRGADGRRSQRSRGHATRSRGPRPDPDRAEHLGDGPADSEHQPVQRPRAECRHRLAGKAVRHRPTCRCAA